MVENRKKILIVDDDLIIAKNEELILKKSGFDATSVNSGEKAISLIKDNKDIDLVLMDIDLGIDCIDGTKAAEEILKIRDIPVVFISSHTEPEIVEKTEKITSYGYIVKNSGPTVLTTSVKMAFRLYEEKKRVNYELCEKKVKEEKLQKEYNRLLEINRALSSINTDYNKNINVLVTLCGKLLSAACALYNKLEDETLCSYGMWNTPSDYNPIDRPDGHICYDVIKSNKKGPLIIRDLQNTHYAKTDPNVLKYNLHTYIGVPIFIHDRPIGTLCVLYQRDFEPDNEDITTLNIIASAISVVENLKEKEFQYRMLFYNMPIAFAYHKMIYDNDGKPLDYIFIKVNKAFEDITGLKSEDITGKRVKEVLPETEQYWIDTYGEVCKTGNPIRYQNYSKELGRYYDIYAFSPEKDHFAVFFNDITELKILEDKLKKQVEEKEALLKEAHHRIKNNISNMASLLSLQYNQIKNIEVKNILEQSLSQIQTMKLLYEELLLTPYDKMVSIKNYINKIIFYNLELLGDKSIKLDTNIMDFKIDSKKAGYIGIVINELLTNSLKHAFLNKDDKYIYISVEKIENLIKIVVKDNGVGLIKKDNSTGVGIMIIKILAEQLDAKFQIIEENGVTSIFEFRI